jgi:hypothetical protein
MEIYKVNLINQLLMGLLIILSLIIIILIIKTVTKNDNKIKNIEDEFKETNRLEKPIDDYLKFIK